MMTREEYCKVQLKRFMLEYSVKDPKDLIPHIYSSTTMGICLQELGIINPNDYPQETAYLNTRGGIVAIYTEALNKNNPDSNEQCHTLSFREFLDLLPRTFEEPKDNPEPKNDDDYQEIILDTSYLYKGTMNCNITIRFTKSYNMIYIFSSYGEEMFAGYKLKEFSEFLTKLLNNEYA